MPFRYYSFFHCLPCRQTLDVLAVVVVLSRSRFNLIDPENACVLVGGSTGVALALAWLLVPSLRRRWRALVAGAKWWRQASYIMAKAMVRGGPSSLSSQSSTASCTPCTQPGNESRCAVPRILVSGPVLTVLTVAPVCPHDS